jgi:hypothetical protein
MLHIPQKQKDQLWWLIIAVDYDYSRITIADHELVLWLEDKNNFKNSLSDCLKVEIPHKDFAKVIKADNLNSFEGTRIHPKKQFVYKTRIEINEPIKWYTIDASPVEQKWAREAVLKTVMNQLIENDVKSVIEDDADEDNSYDGWGGYEFALYD